MILVANFYKIAPKENHYLSYNIHNIFRFSKIAITGIGKTYLAAFDSKEYKRILFVAHREEILKQAERSFANVRPLSERGFFIGSQKEMNKDIVFASVQSLGKLRI